MESNPSNLPSGIIIYPTYQTVKGGQVSVQVGNTTNEDIKMPRNQKIAKVTLPEEVIPEYYMELDETGRKIVHLQEQQHQAGPSNSDTDIPDLDLGDISEFTEDQKARLMTIIKENRGIFSTGEDDIGCTDVIEHDIITTDETPIKQPDRRIPPQLQPEVRNGSNKV